MEIKTTKETTNVFGFVYENEILNATNGKFIFETFTKDMFSNKASWTKFLKRVENGEIANKLSYKTKDNYVKKIDFDTIEVFSKQGFNIATGFILDENNEKIFIYDTYKKITLKIDYEYYFNKNDI